MVQERGGGKEPTGVDGDHVRRKYLKSSCVAFVSVLDLMKAISVHNPACQKILRSSSMPTRALDW